ncbi:MAG: hypothetical protein WD872_03755 [Pirellulaceae bacterium]
MKHSRAAYRRENRMPRSPSPVIGTIAMRSDEATPASRAGTGADDSSLGSLLASLAHCSSLADDELTQVRLVASTRLCRYLPGDEAHTTVRADLARLVEDLEREVEALADR